MKMVKLRKAHCSPPLVGEDNSMVFTSHSVPFPAAHSWLEMAPHETQKPFNFFHTSDGKQILIINFGMIFLTAVEQWKLRKAHCSPPLVREDNSMVSVTSGWK